MATVMSQSDCRLLTPTCLGAVSGGQLAIKRRSKLRASVNNKILPTELRIAATG